MSITIPDPYLMSLVFVVFLITMILLNVWLFKPLIGFMDEREATLRKDLDLVSSSDTQVQEIQQQIIQAKSSKKLPMTQRISMKRICKKNKKS